MEILPSDYKYIYTTIQYLGNFIALLKAKIPLQLGKLFSSDDEVSVYIMYSNMYWLLQ